MILASRSWGPTDAARTAILVHGVTGWSATWWRVGPALAADGWRVHALDLRCHGESPCGGTFTLPDLAEDVISTVDSLLDGRAPELLIGHSLGAMTALTILQLRSAFASRAVLEDPPGRSAERDFPTLAAGWRADVAHARSDPEAAVDRALTTNPRWHREDAVQDVEALARCEIETIIASFLDRWTFEASPLLRPVQVPTLLLLGAEDGGSVITGEVRREVVGVVGSLPAGSAWREFDAGHVVHRDQFDAYVAAVRDFVSR